MSLHRSLLVVASAAMCLSAFALMPGSAEPPAPSQAPGSGAASDLTEPVPEGPTRSELPLPAHEPERPRPAPPCPHEHEDAEPEPNAMLRGWVVERGIGSPVAGCRIWIAQGCAGCGALEQDRVTTASTDERGRFTLPLRRGLVSLRVERSGFATTVYEPVDVSTPEMTLAVPIELERSVDASVLLRHKGRPVVAGFAMLLPVASDAPPVLDPRAARSHTQMPACSERFASDGSVRFRNLTEGRYLASFMAEGLPLCRVEFSVANARSTLPTLLNLGAGACVRGWVRDPRGVGVPGTITVSEGRGPGADASAQVARDGWFELTGLCEGPATLHFGPRQDPSGTTFRVSRTVDLRDAHVQEIDVQVPARMGTTRGTIRGLRAQTRSLALTLIRKTPESTVEIAAQVRGDSFCAPLTEAGEHEYLLTAEEDGRLLRQSGKVLLAPGAEARIALARASLEVRVSGSPAQHAGLFLALAATEGDRVGALVRHPTDSTVPDAQGVVCFEELAPGEYCVLAAHEAREATLLGRVNVSATDTRVSLTVAAPQVQ